MDFSAMLTKILMFVILIIIGYLFSRKGLLSPEFNRCTSKLLVNLFIPASILSSVLSDRPEMSAKELWTSLALLALSIIICYIIGFIYAKLINKNGDSEQKEMLMSVTNTLFVGMPILAAAFGTSTNFLVGMSCVPYNLILYSYGVWRLKKEKTGISLKSMANTCLIAALVSLAVFLINPPIPAPVTGIVSSIAAVTVPLSMVLIGSTMGRSNPVSELRQGRTWIFMAVRLIVAPVVTYYITRCFTDNIYLLATCTALSGCPTGIVMTALSIQYNHDAEYASKIITISTLLSIITLPVFLYILF